LAVSESECRFEDSITNEAEEENEDEQIALEDEELKNQLREEALRGGGRKQKRRSENSKSMMRMNWLIHVSTGNYNSYILDYIGMHHGFNVKCFFTE
jgi:hypothetical protein